MTLIQFTRPESDPPTTTRSVYVNPDRVVMVYPVGLRTRIMFGAEEGIEVAQDYEEVLTCFRNASRFSQ